jgi:hypothetical protein
MRKRTPGMAYPWYRPIPSSIWVTIETPMLRTLRLGLTGPTCQWGYVSGVVLDTYPLVLLPWSGHGLVFICIIVPSWLYSSRSGLPPL